MDVIARSGLGPVAKRSVVASHEQLQLTTHWQLRSQFEVGKYSELVASVPESNLLLY